MSCLFILINQNQFHLTVDYHWGVGRKKWSDYPDFYFRFPLIHFLKIRNHEY